MVGEAVDARHAFAGVCTPPAIALGLSHVTTAGVWVMGVPARELIVARQGDRTCSAVRDMCPHTIMRTAPPVVGRGRRASPWPARPEQRTSLQRL